MFTRTYIKTITPVTITPNTITHVTVYSNKNLSEGKAMQAAQAELRALGFMVYDLTYDRSSDRTGMVSALVR